MNSNEIKAEIANLKTKYSQAAKHSKMHTEGFGVAEDFGGWTSTDEAALSDACNRLSAAEFEAQGWNAATLSDRRAKWNAFWGAAGRSMDHATREAAEKSFGFNLADLKKAVALYA